MGRKSEGTHFGGEVEDLLGGSLLEERNESTSRRDGSNDIDLKLFLEELQVGPDTNNDERKGCGERNMSSANSFTHTQ